MDLLLKIDIDRKLLINALSQVSLSAVAGVGIRAHNPEKIDEILFYQDIESDDERYKVSLSAEYTIFLNDLSRVYSAVEPDKWPIFRVSCLPRFIQSIQCLPRIEDHEDVHVEFFQSKIKSVGCDDTNLVESIMVISVEKRWREPGTNPNRLPDIISHPYVLSRVCHSIDLPTHKALVSKSAPGEMYV